MGNMVSSLILVSKVTLRGSSADCCNEKISKKLPPRWSCKNKSHVPSHAKTSCWLRREARVRVRHVLWPLTLILYWTLGLAFFPNTCPPLKFAKWHFVIALLFIGHHNPSESLPSIHKLAWAFRCVISAATTTTTTTNKLFRFMKCSALNNNNNSLPYSPSLGAGWWKHIIVFSFCLNNKTFKHTFLFNSHF